uniref:Reverse transcriptase/retrotransposon-derived protein RNase H-like domain-containing protein n=1 Tax=Tanacetum cinerariifolium TaxID=118510 RepID=A0A6L2KS99_TANCI|nr:hypothetical protein [Tanacetum cinerariifolium]
MVGDLEDRGVASIVTSSSSSVVQDRDHKLLTRAVEEAYKEDDSGDGVHLWSPQAELAFENLQHAMVTSLVLALPKFEEVFVTATDGHPIAYLSKTLALKHQSLSTYEKELLDVILALQK